MADLAPAVQSALKLIQPGLQEHQSRLKNYDHSYEVYRAEKPVTARGVEPWQSQLRIKYAMQVIDTALVNIVSGQPRIVVAARTPDGAQSAKAMQSILDYYTGEDHLVEKQPPFVQQGLIYGVTAAKVHWLYRERQRPVRTFRFNPDDPTTPQTDVQMANVVVRDGPTFEPWNIYHCYWEPGARDVDDAAYVVLQSWLSKDELQQLAFNPDSNSGVYHNIDDLLKAGSYADPESTRGPSVYGGRYRTVKYKDKFLVEEIWTDDELVVVGNRQVLLRQQPNPYWHGRKPVVITQTRPDLFEMNGISETELVDHIQQALHTVQNMRFDNLHLTVMRGITYREGGVTDPNMLELRPRFKWPVSDHGDIQPFEVQPLPPEAYGEENTLISRMQLVTGINPFISGSDLQTVDQNTATGVTALQEVAGRLLRFKAAQIQYKGYQRAFEMWGDMVQQFLDRNLEVKIVGPGNQEQWLRVGPQDVTGHFNYKIEGSEESLSRQQERGEAIALLNAFAPLLPSRPDINIRPILERVAAAYDFPNPESLFNPVPQQPPAAPQAGAFNPQLRGPMLGMGVPPSHLNVHPGEIAQGPQLGSALGVIGSGATFG